MRSKEIKLGKVEVKKKVYQLPNLESRIGRHDSQDLEKVKRVTPYSYKKGLPHLFFYNYHYYLQLSAVTAFQAADHVDLTLFRPPTLFLPTFASFKLALGSLASSHVCRRDEDTPGFP